MKLVCKAPTLKGAWKGHQKVCIGHLKMFWDLNLQNHQSFRSLANYFWLLSYMYVKKFYCKVPWTLQLTCTKDKVKPITMDTAGTRESVSLCRALYRRYYTADSCKAANFKTFLRFLEIMFGMSLNLVKQKPEVRPGWVKPPKNRIANGCLATKAIAS